MKPHVIAAIFKRNFVSYFSNPTGYVFICVFVLLSSFAAFWPEEFFNANLANLDQLNKYLPYILLVFIPAITMSIWADERRQGTDELLLTIPAGDFDVVLGKYLAAVAIYSVSLVFSLVSNYLVLWYLGGPDVGLLLATYFGYWIVGLAMLGIGMVASFLTGNLTVSFILGALFNAPLVFAGSVPSWLTVVKRLSISEQFNDFSRGVISMASVGYFLAIVALMLYLSVVLIGRRHWRGEGVTDANFGDYAVRFVSTFTCVLGLLGLIGEIDIPPSVAVAMVCIGIVVLLGHSFWQQGSQARHYGVRFMALAVVVICLSVFLSRHDRLRVDATTERLSSLAPQSLNLIENLDTKQPVVVEYFISPEVPEAYVQTRLESAVDFARVGGGRRRQAARDRPQRGLV